MSDSAIDIVGMYDQLDLAKSKGSTDEINRLEAAIRQYRDSTESAEKIPPSKAVKIVWWALLLSVVLLISYCAYTVKTCEDCTKTTYRNITLQNVTKDKSFEFHLQFMRGEHNGKVNELFPSLNGKAGSIIVLRTKHHTDAITGETYVEVGVGYKYEPGDIENPKQKEILDYYTNLVIAIFSSEINEPL